MSTATSNASSFICWAGDTVFAGLLEKSAIKSKKTEPTFTEWTVKVVFSGLPADKLEASGGTTRKEATSLGSPPTYTEEYMDSTLVKCSDSCGVGGAVPHRASKKSKVQQEGGTDENQFPNENEKVFVCAGEESNGAKKISSCKKKKFWVAAQYSYSTPAPDQNNNHIDGAVVPQPLTDCRNKKKQVGVTANSESPNEIDSCYGDVVREGGESKGAKKISLSKNKLLLVAAQCKAAPDKNNDVGWDIVPLHATRSEEKSQGGGVTDENDTLNEKALPLGSVVGGGGKRNGVQKISIFKNNLSQVAAQHAVTASDRNNDKQQVQFKREPMKLDLAVLNMRGDRGITSAFEIERMKSRAIVQDDTPTTYHAWASTIVFSGLLDKRKVEQRTAPSFTDWAGNAVFRDLLPVKVHVQDATITMSGTQNSIMSSISPSWCRTDVPKGSEDVGSKPGDPLKQSKQTSLCIKSSLSEEGQNGHSCNTKTKPPGLDKEDTVKPRHNGRVSFNQWAKGIVLSGLFTNPETKDETEGDTILPFKQVAGVVFNGIHDKMKQSDSDQDADGVFGMSGKSVKLVSGRNAESDVIVSILRSEKSVDYADIVSGGKDKVEKWGPRRNLGSDGIDDSGRSEKSVEFSHDVVFGMDDKMEKRVSYAESGYWTDDSMQCGKPVGFGNTVFNGVDDNMEKSGSDRNNAESDGCDVSSRTLRSEKSVDFSQIFRQASAKAAKAVTFRDRDSFIRTSGNSTSTAEASMDFEAILGDQTPVNATTDFLPSLSETNNCKMEKPVGDLDFNREESNSSLPPRSSAIMANSETGNFNLDLMGKSVGNVDSIYDESNSSLPPQTSAMADPETAHFNMSLMDRSVGALDFNYEESNSSLSPQCCITDAKTINFKMNLMRKSVGHLGFGSVELNSMMEMHPQDEDLNETESMGQPTNGIIVEREEEYGHGPDVVTANKPLQQQEHSERMKELIQRHKENHIQGGHSEEFAGTGNTSLNQIHRHNEKIQRSQSDEFPACLDGQDKDRHQLKSIVSSKEDMDSFETMNENETEAKYRRSNPALHYTIPAIMTASIVKEKMEDRVGLVFSSKSQKIVLSSMTPNSPFRKTNISINDELLVINGHRIKNAKKAAEFIRMSHGKLTLSAFKGVRPRESELEMMRLSVSDCEDIRFFKNNGLVHIGTVGGRFLKSGKIKTGDICLTINGNPVDDAERASELICEASQVGHRSLHRSAPNQSATSNYSFVPGGGLVILLVFSLAKLRRRLIKNISTDLPLTWNEHFNECAIKLPSGHAQRMLHIHNDGNCEDILESPEEIDPEILQDIEKFVSDFYSQFQASMRELHEAMRHATT